MSPHPNVESFRRLVEEWLPQRLGEVVNGRVSAYGPYGSCAGRQMREKVAGRPDDRRGFSSLRAADPTVA